MDTALALTPPQGGEWIVILVVVVLLFGAKKLPELGSSVGKSIRNFKSGIEEGKREDADSAAPAGDSEPSTSSTRTSE